MIIPVRQAHKAPQSRPIETGTHCQTQIYSHCIYTSLKEIITRAGFQVNVFAGPGLTLKPALPLLLRHHHFSFIYSPAWGRGGNTWHLPSSLQRCHWCLPSSHNISRLQQICPLPCSAHHRRRRHGLGRSECMYSLYVHEHVSTNGVCECTHLPY